MICTWKHDSPGYTHVIEFDAISRAEEEKRARAWAKERGWKFSDIRRVD